LFLETFARKAVEEHPGAPGAPRNVVARPAQAQFAGAPGTSRTVVARSSSA